MNNLNAPIINYDNDKEEFLNKHVLAPLWPFRLLICGSSGCGKNNLLMNLIYNYLYYNKIYIYAKDLTESKYQMLQDFFDEVNETMKDETGEDFQVAIFSSRKMKL
jgi:hypothetical protein